METFTALVLIYLSLVTTIALVRLLRVLLQELGVRYKIERLGTVKAGSWSGFGLVLVTLLVINAGSSIKLVEQLLGTSQYLLASIGLLLIVGAMNHRRLPVGVIWTLFGVTTVISLLAYGVVILAWYRHFEPLAFLAGILLLTLHLALLSDTAMTLWKRRTPPAQQPPLPPET